MALAVRRHEGGVADSHGRVPKDERVAVDVDTGVGQFAAVGRGNPDAVQPVTRLFDGAVPDRELARAVDELEREMNVDTGSDRPDPMGPEEKEMLAKVFDIDAEDMYGT